jgi:phage terminase small subunit
MDNPRRQRFVEEYLKDYNGTQAAIRAGYSAKTAKQIASALLTKVDVRQAIEAAKREAGVTPARITAELAKLAFVIVSDVCTWGADGKVTIKPSDELTPEALAAIAEVIETTGKQGRTLRIKMHSKLGALEALVRQVSLAAIEDRLAAIEAAAENARDQL